jgi:Fe-Mn family superoxide dismutase
MKKNIENLLEGIDVNSIIKKSISSMKSDLLDDGVVNPVNEKNHDALDLKESFVAEPKKFKQVSEFVSQKTKDSHVSLYKDYVETFNKVSTQLDSPNRTDANSRHSSFRSLKLDETYNLNAVWLHELYFSNCFDPHSEIHMDSISYLRLQRDFGTFDDWQKDFIACAMSAGQGWAVCGYNLFLKRYVNTMISNHSQDIMVGLFPVIVLDMHEHAYNKDYLSDKKSFIISQMREFNWDVINERLTKSESIHEVLK